MKGDFTRTTFWPEKHYSRVLVQQGRVQLDADWNEQLDITAHRVETEAVDMIGECGGPIHDAGFRVVVDKNELTDEEKATLIENFAALTLDQGDFLITSGRYYVHGILVENEQTMRQSKQPDLPEAEPIDEGGFHLVYLHVWQRHITRLEDPDIREVALGGPDTATRVKSVWQVRNMKVGELSEDIKDCSLFGTDDWIPPADPANGGLARGALRAQAAPPEGEEGPCIVPPEAGYTRLENQLYRVEIHQSTGALGGPTFKWSRENGSIVVRLEDIQGDVLIVSEPGKDEVLGFAPGQWVELSDEKRALQSKPGVLVKLKGVQGTELTVDAWPGGTALSMAGFDDLPTVRRWDMPGNTPGALEVDTTSPDYLDLEGGVQIKFEGEEFRTGDYWLIPARTVLGDVLWPRQNGSPAAEEPHGIQHHFCPLALIKFDSSSPSPSLEMVHDCRELFSPLTEQIHFFHVGGTGQEGMPEETLEQPLEVGVANGQWAVEGNKVRFEAVPDDLGHSGGTLHAGSDSGDWLIVETDSNGIASVEWKLDSNTDHYSQRVIATLLTEGEVQVEGVTPLAFNANLSLASHVHYDPSDGCLNPADPETVQDALDDLCENFAMYYVGGDGQDVMPVVGLTRLPAPLQVRVANGAWPLTNGRAKVHFQIVVDDGTGQLANVEAAPAARVLEVEPDTAGLAECEWHVEGSTPHQGATATLVDAEGEPVAGVSPIRFSAGLRVAGQVTYNPAACPPLAEAEVRTVQQAIDELCRLGGGAEPGVRIEELFLGDDQPLVNGGIVQVSSLVKGIRVVCDEEIDPTTLEGKPTCFVTLDMPFPFNEVDMRLWGGQVVGFTPLILRAEVEAARNDIIWKPSETTAEWLAERLFPMMRELERGDRLLAQLTIKGNFIWSATENELYLDGEVFGLPEDGGTGLRLPSGDGRAGGDFEMWFWLAERGGGFRRLVNLNTATLTELVTIPGIGPALANAIMASRPLTSVEELVRVPGISNRMVEDMRGFVAIEGP